MRWVKFAFGLTFWLLVYLPLRAVNEATGYVVDRIDGMS
jgi:hypothetical protein